MELRGDVGLSEPCKPARFLQTGTEAGVRFAIGVTLQGETSIVRPMNIMFSPIIPKSDIVVSCRVGSPQVFSQIKTYE